MTKPIYWRYEERNIDPFWPSDDDPPDEDDDYEGDS
jgi:hypothetical protein